jgi:cyclic lactone autoinducer peptide
MNLLTVMVMVVAVVSNLQPSFFIFHQPKAPEGIENYTLKELKKNL